MLDRHMNSGFGTNQSSVRSILLVGLIHCVDAFHLAHARWCGVAARDDQRVGALRWNKYVEYNRRVLGSTLPVRCTVGPDEESKSYAMEFAFAFTQSLILTSATSLVTYESTSLKHPPSEILTMQQISSASKQSSDFERSYEVRCITDGFEFSQEGGFKTEISRSYRQCEALGRSAIGVI